MSRPQLGPYQKEKVEVCRCLGQLEVVVPSQLDIVLGPMLQTVCARSERFLWPRVAEEKTNARSAVHR